MVPLQSENLLFNGANLLAINTTWSETTLFYALNAPLLLP